MSKKNILLFIFLNFSTLGLLAQSTPSFFAIKTPLIPQVGNFSCWAATIQMIANGQDQNKNKINTSPIRTDSLSKLLTGYQADKYARISEPSWKKIKAHLASNNSLVTYKYFNEKFAHVFLVRGFYESQNTRWLLVNDPWPVKKAKITALAFNQFVRPYNGSKDYEVVKYSTSSNNIITKSEPVFNIYSSSSLIDDKPVIYLPPKVSVNKADFRIIKSKDISGLVDFQVELLNSFDPSFLAEMNITTHGKKNRLSKDMNSFLRLNQFTNTLSFLKYDLKASMKSDYLFDGLKLAFINVNNNRKSSINLTIEYENKTEQAYLYISRFEKYETSERAEWDKIEKEFRFALNNPSIKAILNTSITQDINSQNTRHGPFFEDDVLKLDEFYDLEDISMLPLYGGMVYSFTWPPFDEKIVADPHRQLRMGHKAIFISNTGTPFYRLSNAEIPEWGEIVDKETNIEVEWLGVNRLKNELDDRKDEIEKLKERANQKYENHEKSSTPSTTDNPRNGKDN